MISKELTRSEMREIRRLVTDMCANYDKDYGCLPLDGACFMFGKAYADGALCKYFRDAVLPLNPALEAVFNGEVSVDDTKSCLICRNEFVPTGRSLFCSDGCRAKAKRVQDRNSKRKQRKNCEQNRGYVSENTP